MSAAYELDVGKLHTLNCGICNVPFAMPTSLRAERLKDGKGFWCPNGHKVHFIDSENERLKRELEQAKRETEQTKKRLEWKERETGLANARATIAGNKTRRAKAQLTTVKKRLASGCCPICREPVAGIAAHVAEKHPPAEATP